MIRYMKKCRVDFVVAFLLTVLINVLLVGSNVIQQRLIDGVSALNGEQVALYVPLLIGYRTVVGVIFMLSLLAKDLFGDKLMCEMRCRVFAGIMGKSNRDFTSVNSADYVSALTNDLRSIRQGYIGVLFAIFLSATAVVASLVLMVYYQPVLALVAVLLAVIMIAAPVLLGKKIAVMEKHRSMELAGWTKLITEFFAGFEVITSFGIRKRIEEKFQQATEELKKSEYTANGWGDVSHGVAQLLSAIAQSGILGISCLLVLKGNMSLGALVVYVSLNGTFCSNLSTLYQTIPMLKGMQPVVARVNGLASGEEEAGKGRKLAATKENSFRDVTAAEVGEVRCEEGLPSFSDALEVNNLTFGYGEEAPILHNLSLRLEAGKKYAMVGESGSGKSTLIRLVAGEYGDYQGQICYDGAELGMVNHDLLYKTVSVIHQEVFLFDDTIRHNICLYEEFSEEQLEWALELSGVKKFLEQLPEGLDYQVGQRGERLSGGQRQRIAIARALIRNTKFLILDEGTSALDAENAADIERELLGMEDLTLLTITHHLRKAEDYDEVLCLEHGGVRVV